MKRKKFVTENFTYQSAKRIVLDSLIRCVSFVNADHVYCDCLLGVYRGSYVVYREYTSPESHFIFRETFHIDCCTNKVFESFVADLDALRSEGYKEVSKLCV